ncbi:MAG TPA: CpsB/CapC family capsule biosynthesis tyrosine phosphatase [Solirubrobacteraceae bacterium]|jgi:protein-tyrosine phosphatase|nr:CpsB/CapC family capsule biosynthesis tyrosine phosphatase [Solirubrobacteraceae bacterium]
MVDLHSHLLYGLDDGPEAVEGSLAIARAAAGAGVRTMVATPHVSHRYPNRSTAIDERAAELRARLEREQLDLEVATGAELAPSHLPELDSAELARLRLGDGPWLLLECPLQVDAPPLAPLVDALHGIGHRVLLAHPERSPNFQRDPASLAELVRAGALTSLTAGALDGQFGRTVRRFSLELVSSGLVHSVASDCHDRYHRPPGMARAVSGAGLDALADWLTREVPAAILAGTDIPPRPPAGSAGRGLGPKAWWRNRGRPAASRAGRPASS